MKTGRRELGEFADIADMALGDSEYNRKELEELGFKKTGVLPVIMDFEKYGQKPDKKIFKKYKDNNINFLFVGRLSPNKKQEDVIKTFYYYNKYINSCSRLFLVGSYTGTEKYYAQLQYLVQQLDIKDVHIMGQVKFTELLAYYKLADVFVSMSEHEGFCVPLLECMYFGIPIIAYRSTAIPYTLGGTGIQVNEKRFFEVAEMVNVLLENKELKNRIIERQRIRLTEFDRSKVIHILKEFIECGIVQTWKVPYISSKL